MHESSRCHVQYIPRYRCLPIRLIFRAYCICKVKESDDMVHKDSNSSGDPMVPPTQARKKKYTRAFSHRVRTGCMTW